MHESPKPKPGRTTRDVAQTPPFEGLQAFQASLLERMEAASSEQSYTRRLAVSIGGVPCLLNLAEAGEIIPLSTLGKLTRVPLTQPWYLGLANIRGNLVGIADLAMLMGAPPQVAASASRVLVLSPTLAPNCGLLLASVMGVRQIYEMNEISKVNDGNLQMRGVIRHHRDSEGTEWQELSLVSLLSDEKFLHIGR
ncbi:chemotaxis protein CheW [Herbaspirillum sp. alder98]|uniref:chemotaxis protein CheW n=1 Tax=Herbaspirillum sp. alder98 TaxID=2913096 RepID=UPI001CD82678|nr:chemotaxis protein CheW [Herbaspirillum sp. alder98]MCA1326947.1 chemotaxis protein CheW [Herbaspirillum sp. alder98]